VNCRICGDDSGQPILSLPQTPLTDEFGSTESKQEEYLADIRIYQCQHCGIVQNPDDFDHDICYLDYQYSSEHSEHTHRFMAGYARVVVELFEEYTHRLPQKFLEIGSGDGARLIKFKELALSEVKGVEPSTYLAKIAEQKGIRTEVTLFGARSLSKENGSYDFCLPAYRFDHVRSPIEYLKASYDLLGTDGLVAIEVHNLEKSIERSEYCLFEHEHTVYLTPKGAEKIFNLAGFEDVAIDPLPDSVMRANSLIVVGKNASHKNRRRL
jgi:SAM-dependent methyltransferase